MNKLEKLEKERENLRYKIQQIDDEINNEKNNIANSKLDSVKSTLANAGLELRTGHKSDDVFYKFLVVNKDLPEISHIVTEFMAHDVMVYLCSGDCLDYYTDNRLFGHGDNEKDALYSALNLINESMCD